MKKFFLSCWLLIWATLGVHADSKETVLVNGSVVNKFATNITFDGDNVTLTYEDGTSQTEDLANVNVAFDYVAVFGEGNYDNLKTIKTFAGKTVEVEVNKTLKSGEWASICLPFDIPESSITSLFGEGTQIASLEETTDEFINFATVTEIKAGIPYIINPGQDVDKVVCPQTLVSNMAEGSTVSGDTFNYIGTINSFTPNVGGYFLTDNNIITQFASGESINAISAYLTSTSSSQLKGDANGDGIVSVTDVTLLVNYVLGTTTEQLDMSIVDLDGNEQISVADITQLVQLILGGSTSTITITINGEVSGITIQ